MSRISTNSEAGYAADAYLLGELTKPLPSIMGLQAFVAVAQLGSLSRAATQLHRTQGAVSRQIQQLEQYYQLALFRRSASGMQLSPEGEQLQQIARRVLAELSAFSQLASRQQQVIRLRLPSTLALRWFLPRLDSLQQLLPGIRVDISTSISDTPDFTGTELDAMLVRGDGQWHGLHAERLFAEHLTPMCCPALARELHSPADMQQHCLIHADAGQQAWQGWWRQYGSGEMAGRHVEFDSLESATGAAVLGYGIALGDPRLAQDRLASGELVMPFAAMTTSTLAYFLVMPEPGRHSPKLRELTEALLALA
ncbi:LysR substrate-binding domain-containing protein [Aquitalea sp. USM4]|uniref:LysR substrate-binding domain-containing protein n=1 Tax=Aquitalea sp. USM4 TaxID=1590041 RepID=UPI001039A049|nr:LysR substrate-binding domain-containing protein [Aquitalea sp. USM4]QBJ79949.1 LysR family transcriptional regulator [Aquitalea sp. USM4]